jgi:hypothetical protein
MAAKHKAHIHHFAEGVWGKGGMIHRVGLLVLGLGWLSDHLWPPREIGYA